MSHILNVSTDYILCGKHPAEPGGAPRSEALPPRIRFYGLLALGVSLLTLGFAGALALALASTGQRWSMQMGERIYTGLAGYRLCNPPLQQIFILCVIMCVVGLLLSAADLMLYGYCASGSVLQKRGHPGFNCSIQKPSAASAAARGLFFHPSLL